MFAPNSRQQSYCTPKCRQRARDAKRYWGDPDASREAYRARYAANPDPIRQRSLAYQVAKREERPDKICKLCTGVLEDHRRTYCDPCRVKQRAKSERVRQAGRSIARPSSTARGYGEQHRRRRASWAPLVATGGVACARCGELIPPDAPWDLGHDDYDRSIHTGPEHQACNRATAGRSTQRETSRSW